LNQLSVNNGEITPAMMMGFLREHEGGICMHARSDRSVGCQVSHLHKNQTSVHWFTGSTIQCLSIFKPYSLPYLGKYAIEPGPYTNINPNWYWVRHDKYIKNYVKKPKQANPERNQYYQKLRNVEKDILDKVEAIISNSKNEVNKELLTINNFSWEQAEKLIH
jgi:hypothetical protein